MIEINDGKIQFFLSVGRLRSRCSAFSIRVLFRPIHHSIFFSFCYFFFLIFRLFSLTQFDIFTSPVYGLTPFFVVVLTLIVVWICHADGNLYLYRTINFIWLTSTDVKQSMLTSVSHFVGARIKGDIWWEGDQYNNRKKKKTESTTNPTAKHRYR